MTNCRRSVMFVAVMFVALAGTCTAAIGICQTPLMTLVRAGAAEPPVRYLGVTSFVAWLASSTTVSFRAVAPDALLGIDSVIAWEAR